MATKSVLGIVKKNDREKRLHSEMLFGSDVNGDDTAENTGNSIND